MSDCVWGWPAEWLRNRKRPFPRVNHHSSIPAQCVCVCECQCQCVNNNNRADTEESRELIGKVVTFDGQLATKAWKQKDTARHSRSSGTERAAGAAAASRATETAGDIIDNLWLRRQQQQEIPGTDPNPVPTSCRRRSRFAADSRGVAAPAAATTAVANAAGNELEREESQKLGQTW